MRPDTVILGPVLSEKAVTLSSVSKVFSLKVAKEATKEDIRKALKQGFNVDAINVNTCITRGKDVRRSRGTKKGGAVQSRRPSFKKAYVTLKDGQELPTPVLAADEGTAKT